MPTPWSVSGLLAAAASDAPNSTIVAAAVAVGEADLGRCSRHITANLSAALGTARPVAAGVVHADVGKAGRRWVEPVSISCRLELGWVAA